MTVTLPALPPVPIELILPLRTGLRIEGSKAGARLESVELVTWGAMAPGVVGFVITVG